MESKNKVKNNFNYVGLCYHYLRQDKDRFPRILGTNITEFKNQLSMLDKNYEFKSEKEYIRMGDKWWGWEHENVLNYMLDNKAY